MKNIRRLIAVIMLAATILISGCSTMPAIDDGTRAGIGNASKNVAFTAGNITSAKGSNIKYEWMFYSFVPRHSVGIASNGQSVDIEAEYGVTENCNGTKITFNLYNHTGKKITVKSAKVDNSESVNLSFSKNVTIDTKNYKTGSHNIKIAFSTGKSITAYFYVNTDAVSTCIIKAVCAGEVKRTYLQRRIDLNKAFNNLEKTGTKMLDNSTSLALDKFYYPNYDFGNPAKYRCDTQKWIDLSNSLVEKNWSKEHKAYVIYDWIIRNIAFDYYDVEHCPSSRSAYYKDWSGKWHVWNTKCGVCFDYANILAIMYRAQGIPTVLIGSDNFNHDWNVAYINGRWIELDASMNAKYKVETSDVNKRTEFHSEGTLYSYCGFSRIHPNYDIYTTDDMVINDELMYGDPNNKNNKVGRLQ